MTKIERTVRVKNIKKKGPKGPSDPVLDSLLDRAGVELGALANFCHGRGKFTLQALLDINEQIEDIKFVKSWDILGPDWVELWRGGNAFDACTCQQCEERRAWKERRLAEYDVVEVDILDNIDKLTKGVKPEEEVDASL